MFGEVKYEFDAFIDNFMNVDSPTRNLIIKNTLSECDAIILRGIYLKEKYVAEYNLLDNDTPFNNLQIELMKNETSILLHRGRFTCTRRFLRSRLFCERKNRFIFRKSDGIRNVGIGKFDHSSAEGKDSIPDIFK